MTSNRSHRSSTHITSPSAGVIRPYKAGNKSFLPSQSVPGSRRHSDDEEEDRFVFHDTIVHRAAAKYVLLPPSLRVHCRPSCFQGRLGALDSFTCSMVSFTLFIVGRCPVPYNSPSMVAPGFMLSFSDSGFALLSNIFSDFSS